MKYKAILFDLDGTLLPMDADTFGKRYFGAITRWLAPHGYDPKATLESIMLGSYAMVKNGGDTSNEQVFWEVFEGRHGKIDRGVFDAFYATEAIHVLDVCTPDARAARVIEAVKKGGALAVLATNPMFPAVFTELRARYAGLNTEDFALITTFENSRRCKPNPAYYEEILSRLGLSPDECLMVGNDVEEDMIPAAALGMDTFLLTDCLINKKDRDVSVYQRGNFDDLLAYLAR